MDKLDRMDRPPGVPLRTSARRHISSNQNFHYRASSATDNIRLTATECNCESCLRYKVLP